MLLATETVVALTGTSQVLLQGNAARQGLWLQSTSPGVIYVKLGSGASSTDFTVKIEANGFWEYGGLDTYQGILSVFGIWGGNVIVSEGT